MKKSTFFVLILVFSPLFAEDKRYEDTDEDNGGPSSEFKPMGYNWTIEDFEYTPEKASELSQLRRRFLQDEPGENPLINNKDDEEFFASLPAVLKKFEKDLKRTLMKTNLKGIVTGRIKSLSSLIEKMKKENITNYREITDIVGLRVTLQTLDDILAFRYAYQKAFDKEIKEIRCYGICGPAVGSNDPREKKYWPWRGSGYRRLHFKLSVPELNTSAEIQIGTPYMTLWAEWEHAVVYKGPEHLKNDIKVKSYAQQLAGYYRMLDNIRSGMNPNCPRALKITSAEEIFSPEDWITFGKPNDACNFWNDLRVDMPLQ